MFELNCGILFKSSSFTTLCLNQGECIYLSHIKIQIWKFPPLKFKESSVFSLVCSSAVHNIGWRTFQARYYDSPTAFATIPIWVVNFNNLANVENGIVTEGPSVSKRVVRTVHSSFHQHSTRSLQRAIANLKIAYPTIQSNLEMRLYMVPWSKIRPHKLQQQNFARIDIFLSRVLKELSNFGSSC